MKLSAWRSWLTAGAASAFAWRASWLCNDAPAHSAPEVFWFVTCAGAACAALVFVVLAVVKETE